MIKKRLSVDIDEDLKNKLRESTEAFGGEWIVVLRLVKWWVGLTQRDRVMFMFPEVRIQQPKRTDVGFKKDVKNGKLVL